MFVGLCLIMPNCEGKLLFCSPRKRVSIVSSFLCQEFYLRTMLTVTGKLLQPYPVNIVILGMQKPCLGLEKKK